MKKESMIVTGYIAAAIERAERISFYGINSSDSECSKARAMCKNRVRAYLEENGIDWNWYIVDKAKHIDTRGTKIPYKAEIFFSYEVVAAT